MIPEAFVRPEMRARFESDQKAGQDVNWREYLHKLVAADPHMVPDYESYNRGYIEGLIAGRGEAK